MYNYDIGGQERKTEVSEGIADIPQNKTLIIEKLTDEAPNSPEIIGDLKNMNEVFDYFKPNKEVEFEMADGSTLSETLHFTNLGDFGKQGIVKQSAFLLQLSQQAQDYQKFAKLLQTNRTLKSVLENKESKAAYLAGMEALIAELQKYA